MLTLGGEPDWVLVLWQWDKNKCIAFQNVSIGPNNYCTQCSFNNLDSNSMLVTGNGVYKYYKLKDNGLKPEPHTLNNKKESHISSNYTCHVWLTEGKILVCTDQGEIMLCESNGEYKILLQITP